MPETYAIDLDRLPIAAPWGGDLIPAHPDLAGAELALKEAPGPHTRLARALERLQYRYDIALVDAPPSVGKLAYNAAVAADGLLLPVVTDYPSVGRLVRQCRTIDLIREYERPDLELKPAGLERHHAPEPSTAQKHYASGGQ